MHDDVQRLQAPPDRMLHLWFEPWAEGLAFPPDMHVELHATSPLPGRLELDATTERTAVYGWAGSTLKVFAESELARSFDQAVPEALSRLSTKANITLLFGDPPVPTRAEGAGWRKRSWWKFWA